MGHCYGVLLLSSKLLLSGWKHTHLAQMEAQGVEEAVQHQQQEKEHEHAQVVHRDHPLIRDVRQCACTCHNSLHSKCNQSYLGTWVCWCYNEQQRTLLERTLTFTCMSPAGILGSVRFQGLSQQEQQDIMQGEGQQTARHNGTADSPGRILQHR